jgi:hypothetical protein
VEIFNPVGESVYERELFGKSEYADHTNLLKGFYFVKISSGEKIVTEKIVVNH